MCTEELFTSFVDSCAVDNLELAISMQKRYDIDVHGRLDLPLKTAVTYGARRVTNWLITSFRDYPTRLLANMIFPRLCLSGELGLCRLMLIHHEFQPEANTLITLVKETMILERVTITIWLIDSFTLPHEFIQDWVLPQACQNYNPKIILSAIKADPRLDPDHKSQDFYDTPRRMVPSSSTGERILAELKPPSTWESIVGAWRRWRERN